jgi:hypothetical protein
MRRPLADLLRTLGTSDRQAEAGAAPWINSGSQRPG